MFHVLSRKYIHSSYYTSHIRLGHNGFLKGKISNKERINYAPHYKHTLPVNLSVRVKIVSCMSVISRTHISFTCL